MATRSGGSHAAKLSKLFEPAGRLAVAGRDACENRGEMVSWRQFRATRSRTDSLAARPEPIMPGRRAGRGAQPSTSLAPLYRLVYARVARRAEMASALVMIGNKQSN